MLFNSIVFIFIFLPVVFTLYFLLNRLKLHRTSKILIVLSSLFFYSWWNVVYLPILLFSIVCNFGIGRMILSNANKAKLWLITGIVFNVSLLGFFKYFDFFIENVNSIFSSSVPTLNILLPLGISFITFQKIAYLVDAYRNKEYKYSFLDYSFFVTFFPQLIAGPIVYHKDLIPQFQSVSNRLINPRNIAIGISIFSIGLFKKIAIADTLAKWATEGFDHTHVLTFFEAWIVSLSYTLQLYFDFSGYSDMAIGLALLFNIKLPINFNSPYKALNIQDFWRRWHITLSNFLTKYLYVSLGGNRSGISRTYVNIMIIFLVSGLWHGAGWNFVFWGFLHGLASVIYRYWKNFNVSMNKILAWFITFNFINVTWVFFRATSWDDAIKVLKGMAGLNGVVLPSIVTSRFNFLNQYAGEFFIGSTLEMASCISLIFILLLVIFASKNTGEFSFNFKPTIINVAIISVIAVYSILSLNKVSEFLYFNF